MCSWPPCPFPVDGPDQARKASGADERSLSDSRGMERFLATRELDDARRVVAPLVPGSQLALLSAECLSADLLKD